MYTLVHIQADNVWIDIFIVHNDNWKWNLGYSTSLSTFNIKYM